MPTIKEQLYFTYDGISSKFFNLINVNLDNGMFEENIVASRDIIESEVSGSDEPIFNRIKEEPLEFDLNLAFERGYSENLVDEVVLWLFQDTYKPLYFDDNPDKVYYCTPIGDPTIVHNGLKQGYITITMRCNSPRIYSPTVETEPTLINRTGEIYIYNRGHYDVYPELSIKKIGNGNITIVNDDGNIFEVRNLTNQEDIYINSKKRMIEVDIVGVYRYDDVVGNFDTLKLKRGKNHFTITGDCEVALRFVQMYKF